MPAHGVAKLPDSVSFEGAATVGVAGLTAALGVWKHLGLSKEYDADNANTTLFVHGASTSVGQFAIQLAKAAGGLSSAVLSDVLKAGASCAGFEPIVLHVQHSLRSAGVGYLAHIPIEFLAQIDLFTC